MCYSPGVVQEGRVEREAVRAVREVKRLSCSRWQVVAGC
jgi:hypothetical protein